MKSSISLVSSLVLVAGLFLGVSNFVAGNSGNSLSLGLEEAKCFTCCPELHSTCNNPNDSDDKQSDRYYLSEGPCSSGGSGGQDLRDFK